MLELQYEFISDIRNILMSYSYKIMNLEGSGMLGAGEKRNFIVCFKTYLLV